MDKYTWFIKSATRVWHSDFKTDNYFHLIVNKLNFR